MQVFMPSVQRHFLPLWQQNDLLPKKEFERKLKGKPLRMTTSTVYVSIIVLNNRRVQYFPTSKILLYRIYSTRIGHFHIHQLYLLITYHSYGADQQMDEMQNEVDHLRTELERNEAELAGYRSTPWKQIADCLGSDRSPRPPPRF